MKRITKALLGASMLVPLVLSQVALAQNAGAANDCDLLIEKLGHNGANNTADITLDQARALKAESNNTACRNALASMTANAGSNASPNAAGANAGATDRGSSGNSAAPDTNAANTQAGSAGAGNAGGNIVVQQGAPTINVDQPSPTVTVHLNAPTVSVSQGQPEITVHQPAPVVTIEIPKPDITLRIPKPNVQVAQAEPQVKVNEQKPDVKVVTSKEGATTAGNRAADVQVNQPANPVVHYESEQPQVHIQEAQGQPNVKVETFEEAAANGARGNAAPSNSLPIFGTGPKVEVSRLIGKPMTGPDGQTLGTVSQVILDGRNHPFLIVDRNPNVSAGPKRIPIAAQNARLEGSRIMIQGLTQAQVNGINEYRPDQDYKMLAGDQSIPMAGRPA